VEREDEDFGTRDLLFGGASDRDLSRGRTAFVGEWRAAWGDLLVTDVAVRHDDFSRFEDETTFRANAVLNVAPGIALLAGYGEGIAQPSFVDLFGSASIPALSAIHACGPSIRAASRRGCAGAVRTLRSRPSLFPTTCVTRSSRISALFQTIP
jgi:hypothetical protein